MAQIYTRRLGAGQISASGSITLVSNDGPNAMIVRDLVVAKSGTGNADFSFFIQSPGGSLTLWAELGLAPGVSRHLEMRQELQIGESLMLFATAGPLNGVVTGYVFPPG